MNVSTRVEGVVPKQSMQACETTINNHHHRVNILFVSWYLRSEEKGREEQEEARQLLVRGLPPAVTVSYWYDPNPGAEV
jgi:hypothetical protein